MNLRMLGVTNKHFSLNFSFTTNKHLEGKLDGLTNLSVIGDPWEIIKNPGWTL